MNFHGQQSMGIHGLSMDIGYLRCQYVLCSRWPAVACVVHALPPQKGVRLSQHFNIGIAHVYTHSYWLYFVSTHTPCEHTAMAFGSRRRCNAYLMVLNEAISMSDSYLYQHEQMKRQHVREISRSMRPRRDLPPRRRTANTLRFLSTTCT